MDAGVDGLLGHVFQRLRLAVVGDQSVDLEIDRLFDQLALRIGVLSGLRNAEVDASAPASKACSQSPPPMKLTTAILMPPLSKAAGAPARPLDRADVEMMPAAAPPTRVNAIRFLA
jgi:hypothetical protein